MNDDDTQAARDECEKILGPAFPLDGMLVAGICWSVACFVAGFLIGYFCT